MLHITVGMLVVLLAITAVFAISFGQLAEKRTVAKRQRRLARELVREQVRINRKAAWQSRRQAVAGMLSWKRQS